MLDILIKNGWVIDGTGNPARPADVAVEGDRIVEVGRLEGAEAKRVIDAKGRYVSPGFIDVHSHSDWSILTNPEAQSTIRQGVTTEIVGNCGYSNAPVTPVSRDSVVTRLRGFSYEGPVEWTTFASFLDHIAKAGMSCNMAWFLGHNTVRAAAGVDRSQATEDELREMEGYVAEAMEAGAIGLATGLEFEPGRTAPTDEMVRLNKVVGKYDGYYTSHIRNRADQLLDALDEFYTIQTEGGTRGQVSHLNVRHNTTSEGMWERGVAKVEGWRSAGVDVLCDCTPLVDGIGQATGILPPWMREGGPEKMVERMKDPETRARLRNDCDRYWRFMSRGDWHRVRMLQSNVYPELVGMNFREIAKQWGRDEWDTYFDILAAHGTEMDNVMFVAQLFTDEHVADMVSHPLFMLAVDSYTGTIDGPLSEQLKHPLSFIGMIHYIAYHVRERGTLRLEEAVRKMTSMPATHFQLKGRGFVTPGSFADLVVFDYENLKETSTMADPLHYVEGVDHVIVNGVPVVDAADHTGARPGRSLLRA